MLLDDLKAIVLRDLAGLERELDLYPDDESLWREVPGLPNTAGTLFLHVAGNVQHYFGTVMAQGSYVRDREAEFTRRGVPRAEVKTELAAARQAVLAAFETLREERLDEAFPVKIGEAQLSTRLSLLQLMTHLTYHLGQIDYHRRMSTGNAVSAGTLLPPVLPA